MVEKVSLNPQAHNFIRYRPTFIFYWHIRQYINNKLKVIIITNSTIQR